jgi:uncharacterized protein YciI
MKTVFLASCAPGKLWAAGQPMHEQPFWAAHASFTDALFDSGHLLFGGPLPEAPGRFVLVVAAGQRSDVFALLCQDPWTTHDVMKVEAVHAWEWTMNTGAQRRTTGSVRKRATG